VNGVNGGIMFSFDMSYGFMMAQQQHDFRILLRDLMPSFWPFTVHCVVYI